MWKRVKFDISSAIALRMPSRHYMPLPQSRVCAAQFSCYETPLRLERYILRPIVNTHRLPRNHLISNMEGTQLQATLRASVHNIVLCNISSLYGRDHPAQLGCPSWELQGTESRTGVSGSLTNTRNSTLSRKRTWKTTP